MISVVVPVYNMKGYLPRSMDALLQQVEQDYEIILVDDGSMDGSAALCDWYALEYPERVHCIHKENGGLSSARNAGMDAASGEFVIFPDPDDWTEAEYLHQLGLLQKQYDADLVCTGYTVDYDDHQVPVNPDQTIRLLDAAEARAALMLPPCMGGFAWNKLYRLDLIREHDLRFADDAGLTEDLDFAFRYLGFCRRICFAPEYRTYHYYQHSGAATHSRFSSRKADSIRTYERILQASADNEAISRAAREEICNTALNLLWEFGNAEERDESIGKRLRWYLRSCLSDYLKSNRYGTGRKLQAILANVSPGVYRILKNRFTKG